MFLTAHYSTNKCHYTQHISFFLSPRIFDFLFSFPTETDEDGEFDWLSVIHLILNLYHVMQLCLTQ